jgi:hypothetical protein
MDTRVLDIDILYDRAGLADSVAPGNIGNDLNRHTSIPLLSNAFRLIVWSVNLKDLDYDNTPIDQPVSDFYLFVLLHFRHLVPKPQ